jgi:hypothetical protein
MLQIFAGEVVNCCERARRAREKADFAINDGFKVDFLAAEALAPAHNYKQQHRMPREQRRSFDPDDIARLDIAYHGALDRLGLADREDGATLLVASRITDLATRGRARPPASDWGSGRSAVQVDPGRAPVPTIVRRRRSDQRAADPAPIVAAYGRPASSVGEATEVVIERHSESQGLSRVLHTAGGRPRLPWRRIVVVQLCAGAGIRTAWQGEVIMKAKFGVIAISALVLMASEASARNQSSAPRSVRHPPRIFGQAMRQTSRFPSSQDIYQSYPQGHRYYSNPDRGPYPTPIPSSAKAMYSPGEM